MSQTHFKESHDIRQASLFINSFRKSHAKVQPFFQSVSVGRKYFTLKKNIHENPLSNIINTRVENSLKEYHMQYHIPFKNYKNALIIQF